MTLSVCCREENKKCLSLRACCCFPLKFLRSAATEADGGRQAVGDRFRSATSGCFPPGFACGETDSEQPCNRNPSLSLKCQRFMQGATMKNKRAVKKEGRRKRWPASAKMGEGERGTGGGRNGLNE
ncbi:hypothetical protein GQ607_015351 [Colletotrichum asianum]|uniref:Uncharacterized protein n=1 Tax=Colletotrichum asianum TaxID=702518 RepID=A0A8H3W039_9PEZI|nr:hypothetical protein GQ607_015351 [Colletotrichum asianum]